MCKKFNIYIEKLILATKKNNTKLQHFFSNVFCMCMTKENCKLQIACLYFLSRSLSFSPFPSPRQCRAVNSELLLSTIVHLFLSFNSCSCEW